MNRFLSRRNELFFIFRPPLEQLRIDDKKTHVGRWAVPPVICKNILDIKGEAFRGVGEIPMPNIIESVGMERLLFAERDSLSYLLCLNECALPPR